MIARISTTLPCNTDDFWDIIIKPNSLQYVTSPVIKFKPIDHQSLESDWIPNKLYILQIYLFNIIPLGNHNIELKEIDRSKNIIKSEETGLLARVWNHTITFSPSGKNEIHYVDEIEIQAGILTPVIWTFAHLFYRHRQRRWKKLLADTMS